MWMCAACGRLAGGSLLFKAPRHVDIHYEPLRFCVVGENRCGVTFTVRKREWSGGEMVLYHGDALEYGQKRLVVRCAEVPWWEMPRLPPPAWGPPAAAPATASHPPRPAAAPHHPERPTNQTGGGRARPQQEGSLHQYTLFELERHHAEKRRRMEGAAGGGAAGPQQRGPLPQRLGGTGHQYTLVELERYRAEKQRRMRRTQQQRRT